MATVSKITETVEVPVTTIKKVEKVTGITLQLSLAEAVFIKALLGTTNYPGQIVLMLYHEILSDGDYFLRSKFQRSLFSKAAELVPNAEELVNNYIKENF